VLSRERDSARRNRSTEAATRPARSRSDRAGPAPGGGAQFDEVRAKLRARPSKDSITTQERPDVGDEPAIPSSWSARGLRRTTPFAVRRHETDHESPTNITALEVTRGISNVATDPAVVGVAQRSLKRSPAAYERHLEKLKSPTVSTSQRRQRVTAAKPNR